MLLIVPTECFHLWHAILVHILGLGKLILLYKYLWYLSHGHYSSQIYRTASSIETNYIALECGPVLKGCKKPGEELF